jgi:aryl-alcohol dehydrogenase-like predicted oxidoreductase
MLRRMKQRRLGSSGLRVSEICLGTMTFGFMADEAESLRILDKAFDAGVDFIDVAEIYPVPPNRKHAGKSEEIVGKWLKTRSRDEVAIATKVAGPSGGWFAAPLRGGRTCLDAHNIERAVEGSLKRLGTDYIDLYQTHWPDFDVPIEVTLEALDNLVHAGKVRYIGCSNESAHSLTKALVTAEHRDLARFQTIQNNFSLLNRRFEDELSTVCKREKVSLIPYSPIAGGVLSGKYEGGAWPDNARFSAYRNDDKRGKAMTARFLSDKARASTTRIVALAKEAGMSPVTLATAWTLTRDFVASTIIGARTAAQLDETLAAADVTLPFELLIKLDELSREIMYPMG